MPSSVKYRSAVNRASMRFYQEELVGVQAISTLLAVVQVPTRVSLASGKTRSVTRRRVKNNRLNAAGYGWAFCALTASPGARAHYDRRRDAGDRHAAAQRNLFGRVLGCLHHCLITGQHYDEATAFPAPTKLPTAA